ncbi:MAG: hypothetical protein WCP11_01390 [Candidatus Saccharibacteria bacterium]
MLAKIKVEILSINEKEASHYGPEGELIDFVVNNGVIIAMVVLPKGTLVALPYTYIRIKGGD